MNITEILMARKYKSTSNLYRNMYNAGHKHLTEFPRKRKEVQEALRGLNLRTIRSEESLSRIT